MLSEPGKEPITPALLLDVDGDGAPEIFYRRGGNIDLGYDGCPC